MSIVYIVLLLGGLIFFHELGHYVVARLHGVHVETFSIGFGPKIAGFKGKKREGLPQTEYIIGLLPLGGYVKMLGYDPSEEVPPQLERVAFSGKPVWKRFNIVAAGPVFNLILPVIILFFAGLSTSELMPSTLGTVARGGPAWEAGLRPGDRITGVAGEEIHYWWQVQDRIEAHPDEQIEVTWDRRGKPMSALLRPEIFVERHGPRNLNITEEVGRIGITPAYSEPVVAVKAGSQAAEAGIQSWDRVVSVDGEPVQRLDALLALLQDKAGRPVKLTLLRETEVATKGLDLGLSTPVEVVLPPAAEGGDATRGLLGAEMVVWEVSKGTAAHEIGLKRGDRIVSLDGQEFDSWGFFESAIQGAPLSKKFELVWDRDGEIMRSSEFKLTEVAAPHKVNPDHKEAILGVAPRRAVNSPALIPNDHALSYALHNGFSQTGHMIWMTFSGIAGLFKGNVPLSELGGPILIGQMAAETGDRGWGYFFFIMALISVNLGLINLLPIPLFDGGQILFLAIEAVRRRPVSLRTRQIATYVGMAFILMLFVLVMKNDIERAFFG